MHWIRMVALEGTASVAEAGRTGGDCFGLTGTRRFPERFSSDAAVNGDCM
jgi:hypothetical protein